VDRRRFLQASGLAAAVPQTQPPTAHKHLLITSASAPLAQSLAAALTNEYSIRLTDRVPVRATNEFVECALDADAATNNLVRGIHAIVHVAEPLGSESAEQQIDYLTRRTYNLLWAAAEESVPRVVLLSSLEVMSGYDPQFTVSETWRPRPSLQPRVLAMHLGEFTSREFAREGKVNVVVLRLGKVVRAEEVQGRAFDPLWVEERDVAHAVSRALAARIGPWQVYHIQSGSPRARFSISRAKAALGYAPRFQW
jgi:nucleoside-diphosphate-sugar epimerase